MPQTPHLDRLTAALAAGGGGASLPESAENMPSEAEWHDHLRTECPWYRKAAAGAQAGDAEQHCQPATGKGSPPRLVVKLTPRTPEASTVVQPTVPPGGPGLFHIKGEHLPPYVEHLYKHLVGRYGEKRAYGVAIGVVKKWAAGVNPGGKHPTHTHADVRAAAAKNVAQWEASKAKAHARHGGTQKDHALAATMTLAAQKVTAPGSLYDVTAPASGGKYEQYGLHQKPSQTISPSPPLPPKTPLPTPKEVLALVPRVPTCVDVSLSTTVTKFLEDAARKLERNHVLDALTALRAAQHAVIPAHKADLAPAMPAVYTAAVFTKVPPAEQSSASGLLRQSRERTLQWRKLERNIHALADRIRKRYFHGVFSGPNQMARLSEGGDVSALDKVLALAARDVSFPVESDTSGETRVISTPSEFSPPGGKAKDELDSLAPLDKLKVTTYLSRARECQGSGDTYHARQFAARALEVARQCGAHHLAVHLRSLSLALQGADSAMRPTADAASSQPPGTGGTVSKDSPSGNSHRS